ncbi:hypothetical protein H4582DRAFT_1897498 [Lactarius indigo]|nr:hypothetical protein H4582DRAFT_1897498 [Lactarius indigo]
MTAEGKTRTTSQNFWKEVATPMDNTRSPKQCRGMIHSTHDCKIKGRNPVGALLTSMSCSVHKYVPLECSPYLTNCQYRVASLDLDFEVDIPWNTLPNDDWNRWSGHRLQQKRDILKKTV